MPDVLRGLHHVGITVGNLEKSITFYTRILDLHAISAPYEVSGLEVEKIVKVKGARIKIVILKTNDNLTYVELLQYIQPRGKLNDRSNNDTGSAHAAFQVADLNEVYRVLSDKGVKFNAPPVTIGSGPLEGGKIAYLTDPDGFTLELIQLAKRKK